MPSNIQFFKVSALPGTLEPNAFYYVENGLYCETYVTNKAGVAKGAGNTNMINSLLSSAIAQVNKSEMQITANITTRNALVLDRNTMVLVQDAASGDPTVNAGAALYVYNTVGSTYTKVAEYESLDVTLTWGSIAGRPSSTPSQIDDSVSKSHQHTNKTVLDDLTDSGSGNLQYKGVAIGTLWNTNNW